jgi:hypothetical protein
MCAQDKELRPKYIYQKQWPLDSDSGEDQRVKNCPHSGLEGEESVVLAGLCALLWPIDLLSSVQKGSFIRSMPCHIERHCTPQPACSSNGVLLQV